MSGVPPGAVPLDPARWTEALNWRTGPPDRRTGPALTQQMLQSTSGGASHAVHLARMR